MQETRREQNNAEWVRCRKCGHKLFRLVQWDPVRLQVKGRSEDSERDIFSTIIEIKCHSCKEINEITL